MYCELCAHDPCICDLDQDNPGDVSSEVWSELYAGNPDLWELDQTP